MTENDDDVEQENQARVTLLVLWMSRIPSAQRISWIWLDATLRLIIPPSSFCRLSRVSALERQFYITENGDASETAVSGQQLVPFRMIAECEWYMPHLPTGNDQNNSQRSPPEIYIYLSMNLITMTMRRLKVQTILLLPHPSSMVVRIGSAFGVFQTHC